MGSVGASYASCAKASGWPGVGRGLRQLILEGRRGASGLRTARPLGAAILAAKKVRSLPACGRFACAIRGVGACASGRGERADYAGSIREKNEPGGHERRRGEGPPWGADRAILHGFCGSSAEGGGEENRGQKRRGATLGLLRGGKSLRNSTYLKPHLIVIQPTPF